LGGIINPHHERHDRTGRTIRGTDAGRHDVQRQQRFADLEENCRGHPADYDIAPFDRDVRNEFEDQHEQDGNCDQRQNEIRNLAPYCRANRYVTFEKLRYHRQNGTQHKRNEQQKSQGKNHPERDKPLR
jgi:hypothetical protein